MKRCASATGEAHLGRFHFSPDDSIYPDHFPGRAVVPGSLIIAAFLKATEELKIKATAVSRFRFKEFIPPGLYRYKIELTAGTIRCALIKENREVAEGRILYDG